MGTSDPRRLLSWVFQEPVSKPHVKHKMLELKLVSWRQRAWESSARSDAMPMDFLVTFHHPGSKPACRLPENTQMVCARVLSTGQGQRMEEVPSTSLRGGKGLRTL